jgi:hypothetical protein
MKLSLGAPKFDQRSQRAGAAPDPMEKPASCDGRCDGRHDENQEGRRRPTLTCHSYQPVITMIVWWMMEKGSTPCECGVPALVAVSPAVSPSCR